MFIHFIFYALFYYSGACLGSFLYCLAGQWVHHSFRWNARSSCDSCSYLLHWYDLFPIFSFIICLGKCRSCQTPLGWVYLLSEIVTSFLFGTMSILLYQQSPFPLYAYYLLVLTLLVLMSFCDLHARWVPDILQICLLVVIFFYRSHLGLDQPFHLAYALSFSCLLGFLYLMAPHSIGGADIKLLAILSFAVPPLSVPYLLLIASFSALLYLSSASLILKERIKSLPFVPFISVSFYIVGIMLTLSNI